MTATQDLLAFAQASHTLPAQVRADTERLLGDTLAGGAAAVGAPGEPEILSAARIMGLATRRARSALTSTYQRQARPL